MFAQSLTVLLNLPKKIMRKRVTIERKDSDTKKELQKNILNTDIDLK